MGEHRTSTKRENIRKNKKEFTELKNAISELKKKKYTRGVQQPTR